MSVSMEDVERARKNELKDDDTFQFECRMCGNCCWKRNDAVVKNKPAVCALFPPGRMYDSRDNQFHYFWQGCSMGETGSAGKVWTLREWVDEFWLRDSEDDVKAWTQLVMGLAAVTHPMKDDQMTKTMLETLIDAIYLDYDISQPYADQVQAHMEQLKTIFPAKFKKKVSFN